MSLNFPENKGQITCDSYVSGDTKVRADHENIEGNTEKLCYTYYTLRPLFISYATEGVKDKDVSLRIQLCYTCWVLGVAKVVAFSNTYHTKILSLKPLLTKLVFVSFQKCLHPVQSKQPTEFLRKLFKLLGK